MDAFMERAVQLAEQNVKEGGTPFGAVLVKDDKVVTEGVNELHLHHDVTGHVKLLAIRKAQQKLQTNDLSGYRMYASGEPCPMCLTSMYYVGISDIYYCASIAEAAVAGLGASTSIYQDLAKPNNARKVQMKQMPLIKGMTKPLEMWVNKHD